VLYRSFTPGADGLIIRGQMRDRFSAEDLLTICVALLITIALGWRTGWLTSAADDGADPPPLPEHTLPVSDAATRIEFSPGGSRGIQRLSVPVL
jgi:hypothetical protein